MRIGSATARKQALARLTAAVPKIVIDGLARLLGYDARICRTIAIEVGMQNSGLGVALANQFFSAAAALPGAVFSVWHNLSGSLLAGYWARRSGSLKD